MSSMPSSTHQLNPLHFESSVVQVMPINYKKIFLELMVIQLQKNPIGAKLC